MIVLDEPITTITSRPMQDDEDWWRVRYLLIETYPLTPTAFNWEIRRWDGSRFHNDPSVWKPEWTRTHHLWETANGHLVGVVHPDYPGNASLQLHPDYRHLIEEGMIEWAEQNLAATTVDGKWLEVSAFEYDSPRQRLLEKRGYQKMTYGGISHRMRFGGRPIPQPVLAEGYFLRTTRPDDFDDCQRIADLLNAAFKRNFHHGKEQEVFMKHSPSFRHELNLVAEAPDGSFAAYAGVTFIAANRYGVFEPVCTHPQHQRKGLARALMIEGMHRLKALGATDAYVGTGLGREANYLYVAVGFEEAQTDYTWRKVF